MLGIYVLHEGAEVAVGDGVGGGAVGEEHGALARRGHERRRGDGESHGGDAAGDVHRVRAALGRGLVAIAAVRCHREEEEEDSN